MSTFKASNVCMVEGCNRSRKSRGLCDGHSWRRRNGKPLTPLRQRRRKCDDETEYFWRRVDRSGDCWEWQGAIDNGYGATQWKGTVTRTHRIAFELQNGSIPNGMMIDHICRNRACVNPDHLRLATPKQNAENRGPQYNSQSGYRGVRKDRNGRRWIAAARHHRVEHRIPGSFPTAVEAHRAAAALRNRLFSHNVEIESITAGRRIWPEEGEGQ